MKILTSILSSMLDNDLYKFNMGSVIFHNFPRAKAKYEFILRSKVNFPSGFIREFTRQVEFMAALKLNGAEFDWMLTKIPYLRPTYLEWLKGYQYDPQEVAASQSGGDIKISISGFWYRAVYWEVPLMGLISELFFKMTGQVPTIDVVSSIHSKGEKLADAGCHWIDFGTRRRFSYDIQDQLVKTMCRYDGFMGTSNPHFAMKYNTVPHGTYAHEVIMAMGALYGPRMANQVWQRLWSEHFDGNVGIALTDTFTTDVFLKTFGSYEGRLFDGVRHDSSDPYGWAYKMIQHYGKLNIPTKHKRFVFSDGLNTDKYIALDLKFREFVQPVGGIGTHFTNDVGVSALNMVIKLVSIDNGDGPINTVKLSDVPGKNTGNPDAIDLTKRELGMT